MFSQRGGLMNWVGRGVVAATLLGLGVVAGSVAEATTIASDNAGNYSGGWTNGSDGGTGFGAWALSAGGGTGGFGGNFVGDPSSAGITNFGTQAFGQFANPGASGAFANADRALDQPLAVGDTFSFDWAVNFDSGDGNKGFNLYSGGAGGTQLINVNQGGFPGNITINGVDTSLAYGTNPMTWSFELTNATTLSVTATPRTGSTGYSGSFTIGAAPDAFRFYASNLTAGDNRQPYFNNFQVTSVPEPAMLPLVVFGLAVPAVITYQRRLRRTRRS